MSRFNEPTESFGRIRRALASFLVALPGVAAIAALACNSSSDIAAGLAESQKCSLNSDCAAALICALGECRVQCTSSVDCGDGGSCVTDDRNAVCESAAEKNAPCQRQSDCPAPLACSADYRCRNLCQSDSDCNVLGVTGRICARDSQGVQYCADPPDVSPAGAISDGIPSGAHPVVVVEPTFDAAVTDSAIEALVIGPSGGTLGIPGVTLTIPPGALDHDVPISITPIAAPIAGAVGQAYEIGPTGTQFRQPALIAFSYTDAELGAAAPASFSVSTVVGGAWQSVSTSVVDPYAKTIAGTASHLSPYALVPASSQGVGMNPNQADGSATRAGDAAARVNCLTVPAGLVSWWPGDGNANDSVGQNSGTAQGQVTYVAGMVGEAFHFANMAYVLAQANGLPTGTADRTIEAWVRFAGPYTQDIGIFASYGVWGANGGENILAVANDALGFSQGTAGLTSPTASQQQTWVHLAYTLTNTTSAIFVNGQMVTQSAQVAVDTPTAGQVYLGGTPSPQSTSPGWLTGDLDELSIYSRALSANEIAAIYQAGAAGKCKQ